MPGGLRLIRQFPRWPPVVSQGQTISFRNVDNFKIKILLPLACRVGVRNVYCRAWLEQCLQTVISEAC